MVDTNSNDILDEEGLWQNIANRLVTKDISNEELYDYKKRLYDTIDDVYEHFEEQRKSAEKVCITGNVIALNKAIGSKCNTVKVDNIELIQNMLYFHITKS